MGWEAKYCAQQGFVEVVYAGSVTQQDLQAAFAETGRLLGESRCLHVLADCSAMSGNPSLLGVLELVQVLASGGIPAQFREAIIPPPTGPTKEDVVFFETACRNRGLNMRIFPTREAGIRWLLDPSA
jgi:hypothetical protein